MIDSSFVAPNNTDAIFYNKELGESGITMAKITYDSRPTPESIKNKRTAVAFHLKYSAMPPQTPAIARLLLLLHSILHS